MADKKPVVVAISSDHHTNSTIGLCPPYARQDDGGQYKSSPAQRWLWRNWLDYCERVRETVRRHDAKLVTVLNGDALDGDHHNTPQIITRNQATQLTIAHEALKPLIDQTDALYVVRGTEAHVGKSASAEEILANDLGAVRDPKNDTASWFHLQLDINGVLFDFAHHGRIGTLEWTRINALGKMAVEAILDAVRHGQKPPQLLVRSHFHQYADSASNYQVRVIQLPAWQLATAYVHRLKPGALADVGGLIVVCKPGGFYDVEVVRYHAQRRKPQKVQL